MIESSLHRLAIVVATAVAMEAVATLVHRHWMHGPGWGWHQSHHDSGPGVRWERNDLFALCFAALAVALFFIGDAFWWPLYWVGVGMTVYGLAYALLHDMLIHQRLPVAWTPRTGYLARLRQAHRLHHAVRVREGAVSFGFLYAPPVQRIAERLRSRDRHPTAR
ncbi:MAG TPA: beta-carotene hydroxylase [Methylibium sp.]|uniref:beta-carotene hydroxylase n=1 Tax=Methylibium sp. TaxID=2067992 RepID=UPI002DBC4BB0|nr:beta-carotene hydroxylase [Methylibium sp.]HEU4457851.1 beta-carotene hydroxylase [Methylibium sp.]